VSKIKEQEKYACQGPEHHTYVYDTLPRNLAQISGSTGRIYHAEVLKAID